MTSDQSSTESDSPQIDSPQTSGSPPTVQKKTSPTSSTKGGDLRPLRLTKQRNNNSNNRGSMISTSSTSSCGTPTTPSFGSPTRKSSSQNEEFQCRPIRLGRIASNSTMERRESDASSSVKKSSESRRTLEPQVEGRKSIDSERSKKSNESTASKAKATQILNLPIAKPSVSHGSNEPKFDDMIFAICLVDFHHQRGPEIQWWKSNYHPNYKPSLFKNIAFQALPDGSHLFEETFSNFNLVYDFDQQISIDDFNDVNDFKGDPRHLKTLFGCSCVRQVKTSDLSPEERERNKDITRSIVQKAIVIIVRKQPIFAKIKDKLSIIAKKTFNNFEVLEDLFSNLNDQFKIVGNQMYTELEHEEENYVNLNLKSAVTNFRSKFLIIFKSLLLEKKVLIYSNNNLEGLTQFQNNLISLIPNLINNLDGSGCPLIDYAETNGPLSKPLSLSTTSRSSMLRFFGLPLHIFNTKNSFWNPYLPLQQLNELSVQSFMVGCSNFLFLNQAIKYDVDILINLDLNEVTYPKTNYVPDDLRLTSLDRKFMTHLINSDQTAKDDFVGSDDYIRYQFEDYLNSLLSSMRYHQYLRRFGQPPPGFTAASRIHDFDAKFIDSWTKTLNFKIWNDMADDFIFNFVEPNHVAMEIKAEPYSINKNISNFINSFTSKAAPSNTTATNNPANEPVKIHKFIEDEPVIVNNEDENTEAPEEAATTTTIDELVDGFEKVGTDENKSTSGTPSIASESYAKRISSWTSSWGFGGASKK
ncbi:AVL9 Late secretory pathway protein AVL9 [Candida maltosa Xu316]